MAVQEIEFADINMATEWLLTHSDEPLKQNQMEVECQADKVQIQIEEMKKEDLKQISLICLNYIGRLFIYQIYELNVYSE